MSKFGDCSLKFVGEVAFYIKGLPEEEEELVVVMTTIL